jgi:four helix bundle suffix protein
MPDDDHFIPPHGGFEKLLSYQKALIVFDGTKFFVGKWLPKIGDRTVDQMVQAARSGKQNIVEGSVASGTSKETEIKLTNVAKASLEELREDYSDFLRNRGLQEWPSSHRYAKRLRELVRSPGTVYADFQKGIENDDPDIAANVMLGLVKVTCYLLTRQIAAQEKEFLKEGGLRERMSKVRRQVRRRAEEDKRD